MTEILMLVKRIGTLFNEVDDLSRQLGEAIDRRDEVAIKMVLAMRSEPIEKLMIADRSLRELLMSLESGEESARIRAILNGDEDKARAFWDVFHHESFDGLSAEEVLKAWEKVNSSENSGD